MNVMEIDEEKEKKKILSLYGRLLRKAKPFLKDDDAREIKKAFRLAEEAHKEMRRKSGEPYIYHPLEVALITVEEMGLGTTAIIAALLHDVVEDTGYEISDIEERFGIKIAKIVDGLTKISTKATKGKSIQAENFQRLLVTISEDVRVVLIKIADRLHNMRTLESMPDHKQMKIKSETEYIYAPLAHRLGLYSIKSELEDLCLKFSDPEAYQEIVQKIQDSKAARSRFTKRFIKPIELNLRKQGFNFKIKTRIKSIYSIYKKMRKQNIMFEQVFDLFAIRIIVTTKHVEEKSACWKIYSTVTDFYTPNVNRLRDWISTPKSNGYESLHTTVMSNTGQWVEVQIRTERMDDVAEKGYAAHWKYKSKKAEKRKNEKGIDLWLHEVRQMLETTKSEGVDFVQDFKSNLFIKEVFAFTPRGDMKIYPKGATVLDFAFDIHTEIGAKCMAAKANGKLVPFNYELQNGDQIEILTSNKNKANEGWLSFVKTSKARSKIKEYLKEDKKHFTNEGKEIVRRKLKHLRLDYNEENLRNLCDYFNQKTESELFYKIGKGLIEHNEIKGFVNNKIVESKLKTDISEDEELRNSDIRDFKKLKEEEIVVGDMSSLDYNLATCCNPIPGDEIFGFVTVSKGIKVHRKSCPNAVTMMANFGYRIMRARWISEKPEKDKEFDVAINLEGTDRVGLVNDVTRVISNQMQVNIKAITIGTHDHIFNGKLDLSVHNKDEFEKLLSKLEKIDGVIKVTRLEETV